MNLPVFWIPSARSRKTKLVVPNYQSILPLRLILPLLQKHVTRPEKRLHGRRAQVVSGCCIILRARAGLGAGVGQNVIEHFQVILALTQRPIATKSSLIM